VLSHYTCGFQYQNRRLTTFAFGPCSWIVQASVDHIWAGVEFRYQNKNKRFSRNAPSIASWDIHILKPNLSNHRLHPMIDAARRSFEANTAGEEQPSSCDANFTLFSATILFFSIVQAAPQQTMSRRHGRPRTIWRRHNG
jgi:hypothetical protein